MEQRRIYTPTLCTRIAQRNSYMTIALWIMFTFGPKAIARSLQSSRGYISRPAVRGSISAAFINVNYNNAPAIKQYKTSICSYSDDIVGDDVPIFEEVMDVQDIKHSSSMPIDIVDDDIHPISKVCAEEKRKQLKNDLTQYRIGQAAAIGKPAFNIFTNAAFDGICASLPTTEDELLSVKGIGPKKLEMYGDDIIEIVKRYIGEGGLEPEEIAVSTKSKVSRPEPIKIESLTEEQRKAAQMVLDGKSVFISGPAGTGKSHVSKFIIQSLQEQNKKVSPTAPTGVAAINVGGSTLHAFFGIGLGIGSVSTLVRKIKKKNAVVQRINETDVLLVDEVSMLSCDLLETLDGVARSIRGKDVAMGGMQVVAVGDFFQVSICYPFNCSHLITDDIV